MIWARKAIYDFLLLRENGLSQGGDWTAIRQAARPQPKRKAALAGHIRQL